MRLRTNTKTLKDLCSQSLETASQAIHDAVTTHQVTASQHFMTASARTDSNADLEDSTYDGLHHHAILVIPTVPGIADIPGIATIPVVLEDVIVISDEENEDIPLDFIVISDEEDSSDEESEDIPLDVIVISIDDEPEMSAKTVATQVPVLGRKRVFSLIDESDNDEEYWSIAFLF
ncbi:hypothetical protein Tco_0678156 [Tanacetum coccineum]|uniref:Uncharacterized protein n=1 Tax=Tanacetum coccineum TaxID=301880 RepID=A0ABQ4XEU0_9ASTR